MMLKKLFFSFSCLCIGGGLLLSCSDGDSPYRNYKEIASATDLSKDAGNALTAITLRNISADTLVWTLPPEWEEVETSGISFASFRSRVTAAELVVVGFPGDVGGLQANVERWLRQLNVSISSATMKTFVNSLQPSASARNVPYILVDLTSFVGKLSDEATIAVILRFSDQSIFFKMQDELRHVERERENILAFLESLRLDKLQ